MGSPFRPSIRLAAIIPANPESTKGIPGFFEVFSGLRTSTTEVTESTEMVTATATAGFTTDDTDGTDIQTATATAFFYHGNHGIHGNGYGVASSLRRG